MRERTKSSGIPRPLAQMTGRMGVPFMELRGIKEAPVGSGLSGGLFWTQLHLSYQ